MSYELNFNKCEIARNVKIAQNLAVYQERMVIKMKHIIIGQENGGAAVAARLRRLDEFAEIICLEDFSANHKNGVVEINRKNKSVKLKQANGLEYNETYDKLILAQGTTAVIPELVCTENANIIAIKNSGDIAKLDELTDKVRSARKITVIG